MKGVGSRNVVLGAATTLLIFLTFTFTSLAAKGGGSGPPDGDHGRQKDSDEQGLLLGLIYGDQWVVVRDLSQSGNGQPIFFSWQWPAEAYTPDGDFDPPAGVYPTGYEAGLASGCVQPVSFDPVVPLGNQFTLNGSGIGYYDSYGRERIPTYLIPLDPECNIPDVYADSWGTQVMEADSGRFNLARSPQAVMDSAYEEAIATCNQALAFSLDAAGRIVLELPTLDTSGEPTTYLKTIDSPRENLALYQRVMQNGCLPATENIALSQGAVNLLNSSGMGHLVCGEVNTPDSQDFLRAASFLGGAGDKTGRVTVDLVVYLNNRLEVNEIIWSANKQDVTIGYFNFQGASYNRGQTHFTSTADLLQPPPGNDPTVYPAYFDVVYNMSVYDKVFTNDWPNGGGNPVMMNTPVINFVRAADDATSIVNYIHNYALPTYPLPPVAEPIYPTE